MSPQTLRKREEARVKAEAEEKARTREREREGESVVESETNEKENSETTGPSESNGIQGSEKSNELRGSNNLDELRGSHRPNESHTNETNEAEGNLPDPMEIPVITEESPAENPEADRLLTSASSPLILKPPSLTREISGVPLSASGAGRKRSASMKKHRKEKRHAALSPVPVLGVRQKIITLHSLPYLEHRVPVIKIRTSQK